LSGEMKPKPLVSLNHLTVPVSTKKSSKDEQKYTRPEKARTKKSSRRGQQAPRVATIDEQTQLDDWTTQHTPPAVSRQQVLFGTERPTKLRPGIPFATPRHSSPARARRSIEPIRNSQAIGGLKCLFSQPLL
jgi:hypothetical protein